MQSDSTHDPGTTPDDDRQAAEAARTEMRRIGKLAVERDLTSAERLALGDALATQNAYLWSSNVRVEDWVRGGRTPAEEISAHAQVEHPELAWDAQAAVFTTGRYAEGRAR